MSFQHKPDEHGHQYNEDQQAQRDDVGIQIHGHTEAGVNQQMQTMKSNWIF